MKKIVLFVICVFCLCGCGESNNGVSRNQEVKELMEENEYVIVDVRTREEYDESHVVGAVNIPYDEINLEVDLDKEKLIFVYCKSGQRSNIAYEKLTDLGYRVYNLGAYSSIDLDKE